jgi:hypothetical protein
VNFKVSVLSLIFIINPQLSDEASRGRLITDALRALP